MQATGRKKWGFWVGLGLAFLCTVPIFFDIYREAAFNITPHDDYASYLLYLLHQGGALPSSPYVYRLFSVAVAVPFYYLLPAYSFSNLSIVDPAYLQAVEALSAVSYLCIFLAAVMVFLQAYRRYGASRLAALVSALSSFLLMEFISRVGIDPLAVLVIAVLLYFYDRPWVFLCLIFLAIGINEKILIVFSVLTFLRGIDVAVRQHKTPGKNLIVPWTASWAALAGYFLIRALAPVAGFESQTDPVTYLDSLVQTLRLTASAKGMVQNGLPMIICGSIAWLFSVKVVRLAGKSLLFRSDGLVFLVVLLVALVANLQYTAGRVVMFTFPLYLPGLALWLDHEFQPKGEVERAGSGG